MSNDLRCDHPPDCPPVPRFECNDVFGSPVVVPAREGGTLVQWSLDPRIRDQGEYWYTLLIAHAGVTDPAAWEKVTSGNDVFFLTDPIRRLPGDFSFTHYRLRLETEERTYDSEPLHTMGRLGYLDWRKYIAVMRAEYVQLTRRTGIQGLLYKRKISGLPCRRCRDFNTDEVRDMKCPDCYGVGWLGGYYRAVPCSWLNVAPADASIQYDIQTQGPVTNTRFETRAIASPHLISGDVWVNEQNSERFKITMVRPIVEIKSVPVVYMLAIERLPFSDIVYSLPRPT